MFDSSERCLFLTAAGLFLISFFGGSSFAQSPITRGPYIQMVGDSSGVVVWRSSRPLVGLVAFGEAPDALDRFVVPSQIVLRVGPDVDAPPAIPRLHSAPLQTYQYEAHLKDLDPDRVYHYAVLDFLTALAGGDERHWFRTAPETGPQDLENPRPMRFWVVGDSGDGTAGQRAGFQGFTTYLANEPEGSRIPLDAYVHVGDMAYGVGLDSQFSANFFGIYANLLRNICTWASMGNHEGITSSGASGVGPYFDAYVLPTRGEIGGVPSGTESYYSFDYGHIHFVCLNSHDLDRTPQGAMARWLKMDLEQTTSSWIIAFWHHPPYTKGTHDSDRESQLIQMRQFILPILEASGVDLVLTGHSHTYERSMLIDGAYGTPTTARGVVIDDGDGDPDGDGPYRKGRRLSPNEGSVHVVAGHGRAGAQRYGIMPVMRKTIPVIGSVLVDVVGDTLTGRMLDVNGEVRDTFQIVRQGDGPVERKAVEHPWHPVGPSLIVSARESGIRDLEMFPLPAAPDAVVRYVLGENELSDDSPIYAGPIRLGARGTTVTAVTEWGDGRRGPVTRGLIPGVGSSSSKSLFLPLSSAEDDAWEDVEGNVHLFDERLILGSSTSSISAFRFGELGVPRGSVITSAKIQFQASLGSFGAPTFAVAVEQTDNALPLQDVPLGISSRNFGSTAFLWGGVPSWSYNARTLQQQTAEFSSLLANIVASENWKSGNAVVIGVSGTGTGSRNPWTFDREPRFAPTLLVTYDERLPFEIADADPFSVTLAMIEADPVEGEEPIVVRALEVRFRSFKYPGTDLRYQFEYSQSLRPDDWAPLPETEPVVSGSAGSVWQSNVLRMPLSAFGDDTTQVYVRRRLTEVEGNE